ncbi:hypothetical protein [Helicobacter rodentium]|nr:hypothetical protein [Helicobacter rodentium]
MLDYGLLHFVRNDAVVCFLSLRDSALVESWQSIIMQKLNSTMES